MLSAFDELDPNIDWWIKCDDDSISVRALDYSNLPDKTEPAAVGVVDWLYGHRFRNLDPINNYLHHAARGEKPKPCDVYPLSNQRPSKRFRSDVSELLASASATYPISRHPHGGGYLFNRAALSNARSSGVFSTAETWLEGDIGEDVAVGLTFRASGVRLIDASKTSIRLAIARTELPASPETLVASNIWLAHSTKNRSWAEELAVRHKVATEGV
jgi:hypothetical protein